MMFQETQNMFCFCIFQKRFTCKICGDIHFPTRIKCKNHLIEQHSQVSYKCVNCSKVFLRNNPAAFCHTSRNDYIRFHTATGARGREAEDILQRFIDNVHLLIIDNFYPQEHHSPTRRIATRPRPVFNGKRKSSTEPTSASKRTRKTSPKFSTPSSSSCSSPSSSSSSSSGLDESPWRKCTNEIDISLGEHEGKQTEKEEENTLRKETERLENIRIEEEKMKKDKEEHDRIEKQKKDEEEKLRKEKEEKERNEKRRKEEEKLRNEKEERDRKEMEKVKKDKEESDRIERKKKDEEEKLRKEKEERDRKEMEKMKKDKEESDRIEKQKKDEEEKLRKEKEEKDRNEKRRKEEEKVRNEKEEKERSEEIRKEKEKMRVDKENKEKGASNRNKTVELNKEMKKGTAGIGKKIEQKEKSKVGSVINSQDMIELNVGGRMFYTSKNTMIKTGGLLKRLVENSPNNKYFIDRTSENFDFILECMRSMKDNEQIPKFMLPNEENKLKQIIREAKFYEMTIVEKAARQKKDKLAEL